MTSPAFIPNVVHATPTRFVLAMARWKIARPENWTQNNSRDGDAFCASGAINDSALAGLAGLLARRALRASIRLSEGKSIQRWNDAAGRTHDEVLDAFDRAIVIARGMR